MVQVWAEPLRTGRLNAVFTSAAHFGRSSCQTLPFLPSFPRYKEKGKAISDDDGSENSGSGSGGGGSEDGGGSSGSGAEVGGHRVRLGEEWA